MSILKPVILTAVFIFLSTSLYSQLWMQYKDSGKIYLKKNPDTAIKFYKLEKEALSIDSSNTSSYAAVCDELGIVYRKKKNYTEAENYFIQAKNIRVQLYGKENLQCFNSYYTLGDLYANYKAEPKKALEEWLKAKSILEAQGKNPADCAHFYHKLGVFYIDNEQFGKADSLLSKSAIIISGLFGKTDTSYGAICYSRGDLYFKKCSYDTAQTFYQDARQIFDHAGKHDRDFANCLLKLGIINRRTGNNNKAISLIQCAMDIYGKNSPDYAECCNSLAIVYRNKGEYDLAESQYKNALAIQKLQSGETDKRYATTCNNLGNFYKDIGQYPEAKNYLLRALHIRENAADKKTAYANNCISLASLYQRIGETDSVAVLYITAMSIIEQLNNKQSPDYAAAASGLAAFYLEQGDYQQAKTFYGDAKNIQLGMGNQNTDLASTYNGMGVLAEKKKDFAEAKEYYKKAKNIWGAVLGKHHPYYRAACANLANVYWTEGEITKADAAFQEAFAVGTDNLNTVFQFTSEKEKAGFIKNILGTDDKAYSFYYLKKTKSALPYELSLFHRNLILSSLQNLKEELAVANDSNVLKKCDEWITLRKHLAALYTASAEERGKEDVAALEERTDDLEKELVKYAGFKEKLVNWKDIKDKLATNEAAIEFASFHFNPGPEHEGDKTDSIIYVALILKKEEDLPIMVPLCSESDLNKLFFATADKTSTAVAKELYTFHAVSAANKNAIGHSLYDLLWKPMEDELKKTDSIYYAPSGLLHTIAFAAIPIDEKNTLSDRYKLVQLASTASVTEQNNAFINTTDSIALYGGINYEDDPSNLQNFAKRFDSTRKIQAAVPQDIARGGGNWGYLPSTSDEVSQIEDLGKMAGYTNIHISEGSAATEESVKELNGKASPEVLHTATHGFFYSKEKQAQTDTSVSEKVKVFTQSDDPLYRSALLFAGANNTWNNKPMKGADDGILTAYEVSNLYLPNTKLAVLSACQTALGDIQGSEGVYGLQRAFKIAGVKNLVMSLWKVPGNETAEFMGQFYKNMFNNESISDAFYNAQKDMKEKYRDDPYKWAAWILVR
ncbi:MAG: tetratricopeptide repeat protein [Ferruginibacter sp.]